MEFEWDEEKNQKNFAKHKINFEFVSKVFFDPLAQFILERIVDGEERWQAIGSVGPYFVLVVVHCHRDRNGKEVIRIISARPATTHERNSYEGG